MKKWDEKPNRWYETGCYALLMGVGLAFLAAWLRGCVEAVGGLMFGFFVMWQVVRGLVIRRYFWHIAEEKVSFWGLVVAFGVAWLCYWLCRDAGGVGS